MYVLEEDSSVCLCPCAVCGFVQSHCILGHVFLPVCLLLCKCTSTAVWFIPSFSVVAVRGPLCVMPMHRGL